MCLLQATESKVAGGSYAASCKYKITSTTRSCTTMALNTLANVHFLPLLLPPMLQVYKEDGRGFAVMVFGNSEGRDTFVSGFRVAQETPNAANSDLVLLLPGEKVPYNSAAVLCGKRKREQAIGSRKVGGRLVCHLFLLFRKRQPMCSELHSVQSHSTHPPTHVLLALLCKRKGEPAGTRKVG